MTRPILPSQVSPPEFAVSELLPHAILGAEVVAVPVQPGEDGGPVVLGPGAAGLADAIGADLIGVLEAHRATGRTGEIVPVPVPAGAGDNADLRLVLLVGVGDARAVDFRRAGAALAKSVTNRASVATSIPALEPDAVEPFVVGMMLGSFSFHWKSEPPSDVPARRVVLAELPEKSTRPVLDRAIAVGGAGWRSRMLATVPSNLKNPPWLAEQAAELAAAHGLGIEVWDEHRLADQGFGGILAVGQASATPPRLIRLDYTPRKARRGTPTVALVGKGITFDSGGLSIKPGEAMSTMKRDMSGGAVVMSTMAALSAVGCPVRVVGLVAAAENAVSGNALRPGDVIRHYDGRTTEVTNTDAEGRLVLADALGYAVAELAPAVVVDVATLTGGVKVALGQEVAGLFATDDALATALLGAGETAGEPFWRLPLHEGYEDKLSSKVADADNAPKGAPAITAALFLRHFVKDVPWAHLDIASVGDVPEDRYEWTPGPSGFGARALLAWLGTADPLKGVAR